MNTESATAVSTPELIPQPHGGALLSGGMPGNRGGRDIASPKQSLRSLAREELTKRNIHKKLGDLLDGLSNLRDTDGKLIPVNHRTMLAAAELLHRIGYSQDHIPVVVIESVASVLLKMPELLGRPELTLSQDEISILAKELDRELGEPKVQ